MNVPCRRVKEKDEAVTQLIQADKCMEVGEGSRSAQHTRVKTGVKGQRRSCKVDSK